MNPVVQTNDRRQGQIGGHRQLGGPWPWVYTWQQRLEMGIGPAALKRTGSMEGPAPRVHTAVRVPWGYSKLLSYTHVTSEA